MDYFLHRVSEASALVQRKLILTPLVGKVNFEPPEAIFSEAFAFRESQNASVKVGSHMVQMRADRVDATSEVAVMGEVELVAVARIFCKDTALIKSISFCLFSTLF